MDDMVKAALKKWPNVPHCYGWLALDARGDWYMRDDRVQAAGSFPQIKGSRILHEKLREFIERNYGHDEAGAWFFQNGPQRVYVELEAAPWIWRLNMSTGDESTGPEAGRASPSIVSHTGVPAACESCWLDERGRLFVATEIGLGLVHTLDMETASTAVEAGLWRANEERFEALVQRFGYRLRPAP